MNRFTLRVAFDACTLLATRLRAALVLLATATLLSPVVNAQLGATIASDLVFTPVAPCRILDTRNALGALVANTARSIDVSAVSDYSFQGGEAVNCGIGAVGSFAAIAVNITAINPNVSGTLKAFAFLAPTPPTAITMSYAAGEVRTNFAIIKIDQGASANEMAILSTAAMHVTIDVVGYFTNPVLGVIDCVETASTTPATIAAGGVGTDTSIACATGYTIMSGGCTSSTFDGRVVSSRSFVTNNTHFCSFRNESTTTSMTGAAYGRCCRLPVGRAP